MAVRIQEIARLRTIEFLTQEAIRLGADDPAIAEPLLAVLVVIQARLSRIPVDDDEAI